MPSYHSLIAVFACALLGTAGARGSPPVEPRTKTILADDVQASVDYSNVAIFVSAGDYGRLQGYIDKALKEQPTSPAGASRRARLYDGIVSSMRFSTPGAGCVADGDRMLAAWKLAKPHSSTPWIVSAAHEINHASCWRGSGYAESVEPINARRFQELIDAAQQELARHVDTAATDPEWYVTMIDLARLQSWPADDATKLILSGSERYPTYYRILNHGMTYFSARWGGSDRAMENYAEEMSKRTQPVMGDEAYARMYHAINTNFGIADYRKDSPVDWDHMVRSMRAVVKHYPDYSNILEYARISCYSGDVGAFREFAIHAKTPRAADEAKAAKSRAQCERVLSNHPQL